MAIKSHRQTKLRDQCVLLRFYCENAKKKSGSCAARRVGETANMRLRLGGAAAAAADYLSFG